MGSTVSRPANRPWIISPVCDLLFLVGTPLVGIPLVLALGRGLSLLDLSLLIVIFATGHHLPTFLRTYGDRDLFWRYWLRLTAIPLGLLVAQAFFLHQGWQGLGLIVLIWAPWHSAMQTYGFMRIYDAKQGQVAPTTARLDWLMCLSWFSTILLWSPHFLFNLGSEAFGAALPLPPASALIGLRWVATSVTAAITTVYVFYTLWIVAQGAPLSRLKLVLLATSLGTYFFAFDFAPDPVVGLASWEIFHDVQYYAIVWAYNRRLVEKGQSGTRALRFMFRPRLALVGLYLGLVILYGASDLASSFLPQDRLGQIARSVFVISALLHFYYDGFIWRVRQPKTREYLDVDRNKQPDRVTPAVQAMQWPADLRQFGYVMAPMLLLGIVQAGTERPSEQQVYRTLEAIAPGADSVHALGRSHQEQGALQLDLARRYEQQGESELAREHRQNAANLRRRAMQQYRQALELDPQHQPSHYDLADLLLDEGEVDEAIRHFAQGVVEHPEPTSVATFVGDRRIRLQAETRANGHRRFGLALAKADRLDEAAEHLWKAWRIQPPVVALRQEIARDLSDVLIQLGQYATALEVLRSGLMQGADGQVALAERLARLLATCPDERLRDAARAIPLAQYACEATGYDNLEMLETLAHSYAAAGRLRDARETTFRLVRLAEQRNDRQKVTDYLELRAEFDRLAAQSR